jgi:hypothetical protein
MAMEIVEESGNNEKTIEEGDMSWNSSFSSSAFKSSPAGIVDVNGSDDLLWNEIDLAERYLVSAMNEDAASTATTVLQTLSTLMHSPHSSGMCGEEVEEVGKSEHEEMLECAGMVLLQSYRAIGRVGEFFDILEKLNVGVAEWPLILLETGACLQISDGAYPAARAALEEFLAVQSTCLSEEKYAQVVELLVIKVLVKGLQEIESAMNWVERANLTEETRLVILKKIQVQMERMKASSEPVSVEVPSPTLEVKTFEEKSPGIKDESKEVVLEAGNDTADAPGTGDDEPSMRSKSLALLKRFKVSEGFFSLKTLVELALARLSAASSNLEGRALRFGALAALFLFVFLRHRHSLRRLVGKSFSAVRVGLSDLWQLAFSVQINPLAAVHPIAAAY